MKWLLQYRDPHKPCTSAETSRTNTHRDVKPFGKNQPFLSVICSKDLQETDTADHRENSHTQLFMHSIAVFSKEPVKEAVTDPPALAGEELRTPAPPSGSFAGSLPRLEWWLEPQECPSAPLQPGPDTEAQKNLTSLLQFLFWVQLGSTTDCSCKCKIPSSFPCSLKWKAV